jgi:aromatic ring hydroxylase
MFRPLIEETFKKALSMGPQNTQTGPALRQDLKTIQKHFDLITDQDIKKLYLNLSTSIQKKHEQ